MARCALEIAGKPRAIKPPTTAEAINLDVIVCSVRRESTNDEGCSLYPPTTVKFTLRVNDLAASLSVILISRR